jgi:hypothetical protein
MLDSKALNNWKKAIQKARERRDAHLSRWREYAQMHAKDYVALPGANDDEMVTLPSGDQVRLGLIHANVEQTLGVLELPEIGIKASVMDAARNLDTLDTHREAVVEQALMDSARRSGLLGGTEELDCIKRDAIILGHGICYTGFRLEQTEVEVDQAWVFNQLGDELVPELDEETGEPTAESVMESMETWRAVQDEHVPALEFLFDHNARRIERARWHGREQVVTLAELKSNPRYRLPEGLEGNSHTLTSLYMDQRDWETVDDSVKLITIWDRTTKRLLSLLESVRAEVNDDTRALESHWDLLPIADEPWPILFSHPDASPFNAFVPIPANDHPFGVSQIEHIRNPALEADKIRTRQANRVRVNKDIWVAPRGALDLEQVRRAQNSPDLSIVEMDMPDGFKLSDLQLLTSPNIPVDLYKQESLAQDTVRNTSGISDIPFGGSTATESVNNMQIGGARAKRKMLRLLQFVGTVLQRHRDYLAELGPDGQFYTVIGEDGNPVMLPFGREALRGEFHIAVMPGGGVMAADPVQAKNRLEFIQRVLPMLPPNAALAMVEETAKELGIRNFDKIVSMARMQMMATGMMPMPGQMPNMAAMPNPGSPENAVMPQVVRAATNVGNES